MTKTEKKLFELVRNNILTILFFAVTVFAVAIHFCGIGFESGDYKSFLKPWWDIIKIGGGRYTKYVWNYEKE